MAEDDDEFDAIYNGGGARGRADESDDDDGAARGGQGGVGCRVFVRGLPFTYDRAQIRAGFGAYGAISRLVLQKARPGTATIEYAEPRGASSAIVACDGLAVGGRSLSVQIDQQYFTKPPDEAVDDDDADDDGFGGAVCPISFSAKGTKAEDAKQRVIEQRFKHPLAAVGDSFCEKY